MLGIFFIFSSFLLLLKTLSSEVIVVHQKGEVFQGQGGTSSIGIWQGLGGVGATGLKCVVVLINYSCLLHWTPREKSSVEDEIKEKEEAIRQRSSEVQVRSHGLWL